MIKDNTKMRFLNTPQTNNIPSLHIFFSKPLLDMENIEDRIKSMILQIDLKKEINYQNENINKREQFIQKVKILYWKIF